MTTVTRIVIVNDQELTRCGLRAILDAEPNLKVVGEAANAIQAVDKLAELRPGVVLMDVVEPDADTVEQVQTLAGSTMGDQIPVLLVIGSLGDCCVEALMAGACGVLLKSAGPGELAAALRIAAAGYAILAPSLAPGLINKLSGRQAMASLHRKRLIGLSSRERDVLGLLAQGYSNAEIARGLHLGESTVKSHVRHVLRKLGTRDRVQAAICAYEIGLVRPGESPTPFLDPRWGQTGSAAEAGAVVSAASPAAHAFS